jgi:hypothetical protein
MDLQIDSRNLIDITKELLGHLTPETDEKNLLNEITAKQIINSTYIENTLPRNSSDSNILVPQSLYECKTNQVWRYPPHMTVDFLIKKTGAIKLKIFGGFGVPRFFRYGEFKTDRAGRTIARLKSYPDIKLPENFSSISFEGKEYNLEDQEAFKAKSVTPIFYKFSFDVDLDEILKTDNKSKTFDIKIPDKKNHVKIYDENQNENYSAISESGKLDKDFDLNAMKRKSGDDRVAFIDLISGKISILMRLSIENANLNDEEFYRVNVQLININDYNAPKPNDFQWRKLSVIFPYFFIKNLNSEFKIPPQQHVDSMKFNLEKNGNHDIDEFFSFYNQTNCVLTQSTVDKELLACTMFGVFDTIREDPIPGPEINKLVSNADNLISDMNVLTDAQKKQIKDNKNLTKLVTEILKSAKDSFAINNLYKYQWEAIQNRIQILLENKEGTTTIIKAPTGARKTVVFMVDAALHSLITNKRSVMVFPTRILNEDMFKRLTRFIYNLRKNVNDNNITGGIFIGSSDPLYKAVATPNVGEVMVQFDQCPECGKKGSIIAQENEHRIIGVCEKCDHKINYMFGSREVADYLPLMTIATPDKLFYEATVSPHEFYHLRFFGGKFSRCNCGYCAPPFKNDKELECKKCHSKINMEKLESSSIGYFVFDEVHSLYGLTSILLSIFLKTLVLMDNKIKRYDYLKNGFINLPTFETGTATIANEKELLSKITRISEENVYSFPDDSKRNEYFQLNADRVRYRTLVLLPVAKSARTTVSNALLRTYSDFHLNEDLKNTLSDIFGEKLIDYDFILGYLFRKSDGYTLRRTLHDLAKQMLNQDLSVEFLSGDSTTGMVAKIFKQAIQGEIQIMLANLVISLGIDIANLNNIIMMGVPKSMTEQVQTAGRTGRGRVPGHVTIHLLPSNPRDMFLYENFHGMFCDVRGYYDKKPVESTNAYAAQIMLPNVLKSVLAAQSYYRYVLSAPSFKKYLGENKNRIQEFLYDLMMIMTDESTSQGIKREIYRIIKRDLDAYISKWSSLSGPDNYISDILQDEKEILTSLRARTSREVGVNMEDIELYSMIENQKRTPLFGNLGTFEDEATDESYEEEED